MSGAIASSKANPKSSNRADPSRRPVEGNQGRGRFRGLDPGRHYVIVNQASPDFGVSYYQDIGYDIEVVRESGPKPIHTSTRKPSTGDAIEGRGGVLMSCTNERYAEIEEFGAEGGSGQRSVTEIERRFKLKRGNDPLRGMGVRGADGSNFLSVKNMTDEEDTGVGADG